MDFESARPLAGPLDTTGLEQSAFITKAAMIAAPVKFICPNFSFRIGERKNLIIHAARCIFEASARIKIPVGPIREVIGEFDG